MTIIYITEKNTKRYGVTFQNNGCVKVQKFEEISNDENTIYSVKPMRLFLGKSQVCNMTMFSGAFDKKVFDGKTILLKLSEQNERHNMYMLVVIWCAFLGLVITSMNISRIWELICVLIVWLQVKKITICWLRILNLLKRIGLNIILHWMEYKFQIQI